MTDKSDKGTRWRLVRDVVVFPHMVIPLFVGRPKSIKALEAAMEAGRQIMLVAQRAAGKDEPKPDDMFEVGCVSSILQMLKLPDGTVKVLVEGVQRAETKALIRDWERKFPGRIDNLFNAMGRVTPSHLMDRNLYPFATLQANGLADAAGDRAFDDDEDCATPAASTIRFRPAP